MGIFKIILIILAIWFIFMLLNLVNKTKAKVSKKNKEQFNKMVSCAICNLHIPEKEAILKNNKYYCSKEHTPE